MVPGLIHGGVTGFFSDIFLPTVPWPLGLTQPLVKMSTRKTFLGGKGRRCVRLTTSPPSCAECHEIWEPKPPGTLWTTLGLLWGSFTFTFYFYVWSIFKTCCILSILFCTKCYLSHYCLFVHSNNTFFVNHAPKFEYQPSK
jgi:hypothetical protein